MTTIEWDPTGDLWLIIIAIFGLIILTAMMAYIFGRVFRMAAQGPDSMTVVLLLSSLSAIAIIGFIIIRESDLITLAATGVGALAGAVTALYRGGSND